jgi:ubiquinone/menaquinone biosynthesis C-methylase UbiE
MFKLYFENLYKRTMVKAYGLASKAILGALEDGGDCLDCGAGGGHWFDRLSEQVGMDKAKYFGIEWNVDLVDQARSRGLNVVHRSLNTDLPFENDKFTCVFALSVLEHLINGCRFLTECHRVLREKGTLIILTPNISTYFTLFLILLGKMPSTGPHPDSSALMKREEIFELGPDYIVPDLESQTPVYRHLVVYSFRVLKKYLQVVGFSHVTGYGFGLYPFPNLMQPFLEKIDPYHCHQTVFIAQK